jgi:hypothetical protein
MRKHTSAQVGLALIALLLFAYSAQAELVTVVNPSFDNQTLANGDFTDAIESWTYWGSLGGLGAGGGIIYNPTGYDAPDSDTAYGFFGASGDGTPSGADGPNVAWEYANPAQYGLYQQVLETTLEAGKTYTLTTAIGMVPTGGNLGAQLLISTEGVPGSLTGLLKYETFTPAEMTAATFVDKSVTYTPSEADIAAYGGQKLMISLCGFSTGGVGRIAFDNVRVESVPEPSTVILLVFGLFGLADHGWRKRK